MNVLKIGMASTNRRNEKRRCRSFLDRRSDGFMGAIIPHCVRNQKDAHSGVPLIFSYIPAASAAIATRVFMIERSTTLELDMSEPAPNLEKTVESMSIT